jgi:flagellar hook protein FlgE
VGTAAGDVSSIPLSFTGLAGGAANLNMNWNLLGASSTPTISQVDTASAVSATTQNGYPSGQYQSFTINSDGTVTASYSNGQKQNVGQLALANVANLQGLKHLGNGDYATTLASGAASVGVSGAAGLANVQDGALEASNVNISAEFSNLIIAQRAFEANAKSVTTFDTVTQDTINMVH